MVTTRYPILNTLPHDEAAAIEAQSDAGIPLTDEQLRRLGFRTDGRLFGLILLPIDGKLTEAQKQHAFPDRERVLRDIVKLSAYQKEKEHV